MANSYNIKLKLREEIAEGTMAFHFEKPVDSTFRAGQYLEMTLINPPETDAEGNNRPFSIASSPQEEYLMIATRMRDTAFKRVLKSATMGLEVKAELPFGSFTLHNDPSKPAVLLMGGIGITPVRSIVLDASARKLPHKIFLFYSNRRPEDTAFLKELQELEKQNPNYRFIGTMTDMKNSQQEWTGETGYINKEMIAKYVGDLTKPIYYSAGPQTMVSAMRQVLNNAGIDDDYIKTEDFSGY
ncbi:MAG: FAD-dependent oxidoreductase [Patescibacteria group bacterium]|nr:FAD-dependent oxidoreductase [Patescibacteria group bacterium]MDE2015706.1 FAD-dependent oxidoreductase [Patescibacteria group bacterium]MDE2226764.1 FAD-dependent oxidoreductase [Patescibacteria group bacterium]